MKFFISYYEFLKDAKSKNFSKNFKTENFRNFRKYQIFQKKSKFSNFSKSESISVFQIRNMIFLQEGRKISEVKNFGVLQKFLALRTSLMWCWIFKVVKKKNAFFSIIYQVALLFTSGGSRCQKFLSSKFSVHVSKKQQ